MDKKYWSVIQIDFNTENIPDTLQEIINILSSSGISFDNVFDLRTWLDNNTLQIDVANAVNAKKIISNSLFKTKNDYELQCIFGKEKSAKISIRFLPENSQNEYIKIDDIMGSSYSSLRKLTERKIRNKNTGETGKIISFSNGICKVKTENEIKLWKSDTIETLNEGKQVGLLYHYAPFKDVPVFYLGQNIYNKKNCK